MSKMTPTQEAEYALNFGLDRADLKPQVQAEYDRLRSEGRKVVMAEPADPLAGITQRTSPEVRARILAMIKKGNGLAAAGSSHGQPPRKATATRRTPGTRRSPAACPDARMLAGAED